MTQQEKNNFFKLVALIVDVACLVIWRYIGEKILGPDSFETFLNKEKHKLVHIYETSQCCKCKEEKISRERLISRKQLLTLYKSDDENQTPGHKKYAGGKMAQICICKYSAKKDIVVRVVDITLANYIVQKFGKQELGIDNWIEQIKDVRNEVFHLSDIKEMTDEIFTRKWTKLEGSIIGIAKVIDSACAVEFDKIIMQTKKMTLVGDYMLKYEIVCRDYWRNKCAEFERAQDLLIEQKAAAIHNAMPQIFSTEMVKDCEETMRRIQTLDTMVDKINIMINLLGIEGNREQLDATELVKEDMQSIRMPVFIKLDMPTSWDKTKVFEAIDELRLNETPDMDIRIKAISIDDLNMFAEITNTVLRNVRELRSEINKMMSTLLSEAAIDTSKYADCCVNLTVPDISGKLTNATANLTCENKETKDKLKDANAEVTESPKYESIKIGGFRLKEKEKKITSVVIDLQSEDGNVKLKIEKRDIDKDNLSNVIKNLLDDEIKKMHMSPETKNKLSVSLTPKDQQEEFYSGQTGSSEESITFEGKYEVWKTEASHYHEDTMVWKDLKSSGEKCLPLMKNADEEVFKGKLDGTVYSQLNVKNETALGNLRQESETGKLEKKTQKTASRSDVSVNKTHKTVNKSERPLRKEQETVHKSEQPVSKKQETVHKSTVYLYSTHL